jgi:hypothetical protein
MNLTALNPFRKGTVPAVVPIASNTVTSVPVVDPYSGMTVPPTEEEIEQTDDIMSQVDALLYLKTDTDNSPGELREKLAEKLKMTPDELLQKLRQYVIKFLRAFKTEHKLSVVSDSAERFRGDMTYKYKKSEEGNSINKDSSDFGYYFIIEHCSDEFASIFCKRGVCGPRTKTGEQITMNLNQRRFQSVGLKSSGSDTSE